MLSRWFLFKYIFLPWSSLCGSGTRQEKSLHAILSRLLNSYVLDRHVCIENLRGGRKMGPVDQEVKTKMRISKTSLTQSLTIEVGVFCQIWVSHHTTPHHPLRIWKKNITESSISQSAFNVRIGGRSMFLFSLRRWRCLFFFLILRTSFWKTRSHIKLSFTRFSSCLH